MTAKIKELPLYERPYEKLEIYGEGSLQNSELLAILIESGTKDETSMQIAQRVLALGGEIDGIRFLQDVSLEELRSLKGIGRVKAIRLKAAFEIAKRMSRPVGREIFIKSSQDVADLLMDELRFEKRECVKLIILNNKNKILRIKDVSFGSDNFAVIEPKEVLAEPVKMCAPRIILVHNHPSGNSTPSMEDYQVSKRMEMCCKIFGIDFLDHVVIGDGTFQSAKQ